MKDEQESGGHDDEQCEAIPTVSEAVAELTDLIMAEVHPPATHVELVVALVASRRDGHERHVTCLAWLRPVDDAGRKLAWTDDLLRHLAEHVRERVAEGTVDRLTSPVWEQLIQRCQAPDGGGLDRFAGDVADWNHDLLRESLVDAGVPGPVDAAIVFVVPLPGDRMLSVASEAIRVVVIAFAVLIGHPALACASFQSLVHDKLISEMGKLVEQTAADYLNAAAQAASTRDGATGLVNAADEPAPASTAMADEWMSKVDWPAADRKFTAATSTTAPGVGLAAQRPDATEGPDATGPAFGL